MKGEDASGWPTQGRVGFILDNLLAKGKVEAVGTFGRARIYKVKK